MTPAHNRDVLDVYPSRIDQKVVTSPNEIAARSTRSASRNGTGPPLYMIDTYIGKPVSFTPGTTPKTFLKSYTPDTPKSSKSRKNKKKATKQLSKNKKNKTQRKPPSLTAPGQTQISDSFTTESRRPQKRTQYPDWSPVAKRKRVSFESSSNYLQMPPVSTKDDNEQDNEHEKEDMGDAAAEHLSGLVDGETEDILKTPDDGKAEDILETPDDGEAEEILETPDDGEAEEILEIPDDGEFDSPEDDAIGHSMSISDSDDEEELNDGSSKQEDVPREVNMDTNGDNSEEHETDNQSDITVYLSEQAAIEYDNFDYDEVKKQLLKLPYFDHRDADLILPALKLADRDTMIQVQHSDSEELVAFYINELYPAFLKYKKFLANPEKPFHDRNREQFERYEMEGLIVEIPLDPRPEIFPHQERKRKEKKREENLEKVRLEAERMEEARQQQRRQQQQQLQNQLHAQILANLRMAFPAAPVYPAVNPFNIPNAYQNPYLRAPQLNPFGYPIAQMFPFQPLFDPSFNLPPH